MSNFKHYFATAAVVVVVIIGLNLVKPMLPSAIAKYL
jgi:hypothetical protein